MTRLNPPATAVLRPFAPDAAAVRHIHVRIARPQPGRLVLEYQLEGNLASLRFAAAASGSEPEPTSGLWRHTCMEVFAGQALPGPYLEFNLAPSGQWAAYRFSGYRADMKPLIGIPPPRIQQRTQADQLLLRAEVDLPADLAAGRLQLGLTTVVEDQQGHLSYWALRHPAQRPDFHHPDSFGFEI